MRTVRLFLLLLSTCSSPFVGVASAGVLTNEAAAPRPAIGRAPDWVLPATIPNAPASATGASSIDLLNDSQLRFGTDGDSSYYDVAFKIASSKGLDDAPLQLNWDPSLETLIIHRYRIIRDGKTIDLLGNGSNLSIIQREKNLDDAALDGELTATIQPSDVRVGDVIEIAFTRNRRDPALGGHSQALVGPADGRPYGRLRVRIIWPDAKKIRWRAADGVLQPKLRRTSAGNELVADLNNVVTAVAPNGAPGRYRVVNAVDISDFADWAAVSATILPRYSEAIKLGAGSALKEEADRIAAQTSDPRRRAELALQLVQQQIRYLYVGMNDGGYVPAPAELTWERRFGDCKGKTVVLLALLKQLGIAAEPVLVNTDNGDLVAHRLPSLAAFDHVIVRAHIGGRTYWMDGTQLGDTQVSRLYTPSYRAALPIEAGTKALVELSPEPLTQPSETLSVALDASAGIDTPAKATGEMRFRGSSAAEMRAKYVGLSASDLDTELRGLWRKNYDQISPSSLTATTDDATGDFVVRMTGTAKMDWFSESGARWYEVDRARLGWKFDTNRDGAIDTDAPFDIDYPDYWESRETIKLPAAGAGFALQGGSFDRTIGGIYAFHRKVAISGDVLTMESSTRSLADELPAVKAEQARVEMAELSNSGVYVRAPDNYMATDSDVAALAGNQAALVLALVHRGAVHFDRGELKESIADERKVVSMSPETAAAHAILALSLSIQRHPDAEKEAERALSLDPKQVLALRAKGVVAIGEKRYADAEQDFSDLLKIDPKSGEALAARASMRAVLGRFADALSDTDAALAIAPALNLHLIRATAFAGLGRKDESLAEADRAVESKAGDELALKTRARLRANFGEMDLARADFDALIKQAPQVEYFLSRAETLPVSNIAQRQADVASALRLDPHSVKALAFQASMTIDAGNFSAAEEQIAGIERIDPASALIHQLRLQLLEKQRKGPESIALLDAYLLKHPGDASALNERCWVKATFNIRIDSALADCDASLKLSPQSAGTLDSRAFTKLRLGQVDEAISDYDAALKLAPALPASLYGRGVARARKGNQSGALADLLQARRLNPGIDARFASYGITLPAALANSGAAPTGK